MTDHLVSPDAMMSIAGKEYCLDGSFSTLKALQHAFGKDIVDVQSSIHLMRLDEFAKLLCILVECSGHRADEGVIGAWLVDEVGIVSYEQDGLRLRIMGFLAVAMTPNREREKKRSEMANLIAEHASISSLGENTEISA